MGVEAAKLWYAASMIRHLSNSMARMMPGASSIPRIRSAHKLAQCRLGDRHSLTELLSYSDAMIAIEMPLSLSESVGEQ